MTLAKAKAKVKARAMTHLLYMVLTLIIVTYACHNIFIAQATGYHDNQCNAIQQNDTEHNGLHWNKKTENRYIFTLC